jgi:hypothetical protein
MKLEDLFEGILRFYSADALNVQPSLFAMDFGFVEKIYDKVFVKWFKPNHELFVGHIDYHPDYGWYLVPAIPTR